jgi:hypothetical protein
MALHIAQHSEADFTSLVPSPLFNKFIGAQTFDAFVAPLVTIRHPSSAQAVNGTVVMYFAPQSYVVSMEDVVEWAKQFETLGALGVVLVFSHDIVAG